MNGFPKTVRVVRSHITSVPDPVRFVAGDVLGVGHHDQQRRSYVWCTDESGHAGWVPAFYLEMTVGPGELLDVLEEAGGRLRCRTSSGHEGWVSGDNVEPV